MTPRKAQRIARDLTGRFRDDSLTMFADTAVVDDQLFFTVMGILNHIAINPFPSSCPHNPFWTAKEVREAWDLLAYVKAQDIALGRMEDVA
jgi:hypothetical protein